MGGSWVFECPSAPGGNQNGPGGFLCALPYRSLPKGHGREQGRWIDLCFLLSKTNSKTGLNRGPAKYPLSRFGYDGPGRSGRVSRGFVSRSRTVAPRVVARMVTNGRLVSLLCPLMSIRRATSSLGSKPLSGLSAGFSLNRKSVKKRGFRGCLVLVVSIQLAVRSIGTYLRVEPLPFVFVASRGLFVVTDVPAGRRKVKYLQIWQTALQRHM